MEHPIVFQEGDEAFRRVRTRDRDTYSCTMNIAALFFQLERPGEVHVPILYHTPAGSDESQWSFSYTKGVYDRWGYIKVFGIECCVAQLVLLLQCDFAPVNPQSQNPKCINHGFNHQGFFQTTLHHQGTGEAAAVVQLSSDSDSDSDSDSES